MIIPRLHPLAGPAFGLAVFAVGTVVSAAQSVWLPRQGEFLATPGFAFSTFDEFWVGDMRVSPLEDNDESLDQYTTYLALEYGVTASLAVDVTFGYTWTDSTETFGGSDEGWSDTAFGLRWLFLPEGPVAPAAAVRVGGVIAGTYDENTPFSAGDGADAFETSLLLGKSFGDTGFGAYGDIGYRWREDHVPDDIFGSVGLFKRFAGVFAGDDALTATVGYRHVESRDGLDIGGPGFDPAAGTASGFPALEEVNQLLEGSLTYTDIGGRAYQLGIAGSLDGRNTGDKLILMVAITLPFGG